MTTETPIYISWSLNIATAFTALVFAVRQRRQRQLKMPIVYISYFAFAGTAQLISFLIHRPIYPTTYLIFEFTHSLLLCALAVEIFGRVLHLSISWAIIALVVVMLPFAIRSGDLSAELLTNLSTRSVFISTLPIAVLVLFNILQTKEQKVVAFGLFALVLGGVLPSLLLKTNPPIWLLAAVQTGSIPGLILLTIAGNWRRHFPWMKEK